MGRKSSAKAQAPSAASQPPKQPPRSFGAPIAMVIVAVGIVVGLLAYSRGGSSDTAGAQPVAQSQGPLEAPNAKFGPHKQANLPPLPLEPPVRPQAVANAAYIFAAEHPEILGYVPCYCGCEQSGHRGNDDCFVTSRAPNGDVTQWEPHGMTWAVCIDVARDAAQMHASGASVRDIRIANEKKWTPSFPNHTPTPQPPPPGR